MVRKWGPTAVTTQDKDAPPRSCPGPLPTRSLSLLPEGSDHSVLPSHTLHHWQSSKNNTESVCDQVVTPNDCKRAGLGQRKEGMAGWQGPWGLEDSPRLGPGRSGGWGPRGRWGGESLLQAALMTVTILQLDTCAIMMFHRSSRFIPRRNQATDALITPFYG